ncbi:thiamine pyrophosphate-binding protein [Desulfolucanica intricata]|uniref:thiamine pyrophosphate-binding protein n=1 Tax=Desulfolucanica intricata TaxID=1285191 RepID=UPI000836D338|nr:thiamine pyrophosphate-binding protein [Desulfolucanica intricata]
MSQTVAQVILKALAAWGVKNIYGVSGDAVLPLMDALGKQEEIKFYSTASEQGASFMACGEARVTGKPGVCLSTEGPGALNLVNGVADAYRDGIPMLVITGQVETAKLSTNSKQYFDQQQLFAPITGLTSLLTRPESTVKMFKVAMEKAIGDNTPCHISIPGDIILSPAHDCDIPPLSDPSPPGISGNIEEAIETIGCCKKPVVITGKAALPFKDKILQLANRIGAGIIPALGARGIYPGTEKILLGGLGEAHIPPLLNQSDCVLLIGASPFEHKFIPSKVKVVQIDTRPQNLAHSLRPVPLTGDMALILERLLIGLTNTMPDTGWQEEIEKNHIAHLEMLGDDSKITEAPIPPRKVVSVLSDILPENAIIAIDTGEFMHWFDRGFVAKKQQVIISEHWRCMGGGLPFGLGARAACPDRTVVVLTGDGGFIMTMQEILTAVRYSLPVVIIIFNNSKYLLEKHRMQKENMKPFGVETAVPDFALFAKACGAEGIKVDKPEMLEAILGRAMVLRRPVVLDIITSDEKPGFI